MSASPPTKELNVDPGAQSPDDESMSRDPDAQQQGLGYEFEVKEQDRWLPIANVARIMKTALPDNAKIAKEAKECMQECVSEFISFITSEASEKCQQEKRKTVNGEDILFAMTSLGFENYSEALKIYLAKYRETQASRGDAQPNRTGPTDGSLGGPGSSLEGGSHITGDASTGGDTTVPGDYAAGPAGSPNHILAGSAVEGSDGFGVYPSIVGSHNGAAGGAY